MRTLQLLLHGVTDFWDSIERALPHLPVSVHAFALTQRGHGDADRPAAALALATLYGWGNSSMRPA